MRRVPEPITIVIADDHPPSRAGVRAALEKDGFVVLGEYSDAEGAIAGVEEKQPDICILDVHMPGGGISAASKLRAAYPSLAVVMLTVSDDDDDLFAALKAGADGYLLKDMSPDRLPLALRGVLSGEAAIPRRLMSRVLDQVRHGRFRRVPVPSGGASLSSREWEVLELMAQGMSTAEMAEAVFVSKVTIRSHVASILRKLGVPNREGAIEVFKQNRPPQ